MPIALALPIRPTRFSAGSALAVGTYHVEPVAAGYTVRRTIGIDAWYPLTSRDDPSWRIWPSFDEASTWIENQDLDLCDYPFWGR
ncbi:MAG: hypothetical protein EPN61_15285 [Burkholderiaceae bacterium]|nr:MAG: hypothetical protein EPN61_15285 [Burkholderiaceae bacterium]